MFQSVPCGLLEREKKIILDNLYKVSTGWTECSWFLLKNLCFLCVCLRVNVSNHRSKQITGLYANQTRSCSHYSLARWLSPQRRARIKRQYCHHKTFKMYIQLQSRFCFIFLLKGKIYIFITNHTFKKELLQFLECPFKYVIIRLFNYLESMLPIVICFSKWNC